MNQGPRLTDVLVGIDQAEARALKGEPLVPKVKYTLEQLAVHDFYENMARTYCVLQNLDPDELIDLRRDDVPGLLGMPDIVRTVRWRSIVPHCAEFNNLAEAWIVTRDERIAKTIARVQAQQQAASEAAALTEKEKN